MKITLYWVILKLHPAYSKQQRSMIQTILKFLLSCALAASITCLLIIIAAGAANKPLIGQAAFGTGKYCVVILVGLALLTKFTKN